MCSYMANEVKTEEIGRDDELDCDRNVCTGCGVCELSCPLELWMELGEGVLDGVLLG